MKLVMPVNSDGRCPQIYLTSSNIQEEKATQFERLFLFGIFVNTLFLLSEPKPKSMIDFEIEKEIKPNLSSGEQLIWVGKPRKGIIFRSTDVFLIPFSLLWAGFAVFWESTVVATGAPFFFKLWGIPFVFAGVYITIGRFFLDAKKRANTIYGLTKDRVIIKSGIFSQNVKSLNIRTISDITFNQKADNSGTITLGPTDFRFNMMQGMDFMATKQPPRLELIEDVKAVYDKIIDLQRLH